MATPRIIDADGKEVVVKLMDDSWIMNQCAGTHPFKPREGIVWKHSEHCARLPVPGDEVPGFMSKIRDTYGNCAAIAWCGEKVLGHIVFLPRAIARQQQATGHEHFGPTDQDEGTLVVVNLAFCSLSGHEFRGKGIGKGMVGIMLDWADQNNWRRVEVYGTGAGLFPAEWYDHCIPPRPFWEHRGFTVFAKHGDRELCPEDIAAIMEDNPRHSDAEQKQKREILAAIQSGEIDPEVYGHTFDLGRGV